jgi:hypothetical protein
LASLVFIAAFTAARAHGAGDDGPPPAPPPPAPAPAPASCADKVAELQSWFAKYPSPDDVLRIRDVYIGARPDPLLVIGDGRAWDRDELSQLAQPSVELLRRKIRIVGDGTQVQDVAELRPLLRAAAKKPDSAAPALPLLLGIDRDRHWSDVVDVVNAAAEAGFTQLDFVFERLIEIAPPPSAEDQDARRILAAPPYERGRLVAVEVDRILKKCKGAGKVIGNMAASGGQAKIKVLTDEMPPALRACGCATNPRDLMTLLWLWADPDEAGAIHREFIGARVTLAKGKQPATTVKANKAAPWSEASAQVLAAAKVGTTPPVVRFETSSR